MKLKVKEEEYIIVVKGDCRNGDGISNILDMLAVLYHKTYVNTKTEEATLYTLEGENFKAGDIDKNGEINILDMLRILYHKERIEGYIL